MRTKDVKSLVFSDDEALEEEDCAVVTKDVVLEKCQASGEIGSKPLLSFGSSMAATTCGGFG